MAFEVKSTDNNMTRIVQSMAYNIFHHIFHPIFHPIPSHNSSILDDSREQLEVASRIHSEC